MQPLVITEVDPFDLPERLGTDEVVWEASDGLRTGHHVAGVLRVGEERLECDLLAVDTAYPAAVADEATRVRSHQAWQHGEVLLGAVLLGERQRLVLAVPGTGFDADLVLEAVSRLARAVAASPERYAVHLRIGARPQHRGRTG